MALKPELPNLCLGTQAEAAERLQVKKIAELTAELTNVKRGLIQPSPFINGCKTKAALVRRVQARISALKTDPCVDPWSLLVDAAYNGERISGAFVDGFSDKGFGDCRSIRAQVTEFLAEKGYRYGQDDNGYYFEKIEDAA